jgi:hypothetical protein
LIKLAIFHEKTNFEFWILNSELITEMIE